VSVYKAKNSQFYHYDFQVRGRRFHGSTGCTRKREAEAVEQQERKRARAAVDAAERTGREPMTWNTASGLYWTEVGQFHAGEGANNTWRALEWLLDEIGAATRVADIDDGMVARIVARRRGQKARNSDELVSNATVNRSVTEPLRKVLNRARDVWKQEVPKISWRTHMLPETQERVREASADEEERFFAAMREDFRPLVAFSIETGLRQGECLRLTWEDIDWGNAVIRVQGKGGRQGTIPLSFTARAILSPLRGQHVTAVFCYQVKRTRAGRMRGEWRPITASNLKTRWRRDQEESGVTDYRWHDHRHTTATRILRETGNLRVAQRLLRHTKIETTTKYAHVTDDDVRAAMERVAESRRNPRSAKAQEG
jgi:integrase